MMTKAISVGFRNVVFALTVIPLQVLDILEEVFQRWRVSYVRLDGSTPIDQRQNIIDKAKIE